MDIRLKIEAESTINTELKACSDEYRDINNKKSPSNCKLQINLGLSGEGHWAEREKIINGGKRNAGVTERVIESIMALHPSDSLSVLKKRYEESDRLLRQVRENEAVQIRNTVKLNISYDEKELQKLLAQKVEKPILSEREQYLLQLIDEGELNQINKNEKCFF